MFPEIERLEKIRKELGYSRREVSGITGISYDSYNNWVNREHKPNYKNMRNINEATEKLYKRLKEKEGEDKLKKLTKEINKLAATPIRLIEESIDSSTKDKVDVVDYGK